jgi:hypothetical protein
MILGRTTVDTDQEWDKKSSLEMNGKPEKSLLEEWKSGIAQCVSESISLKATKSLRHAYLSQNQPSTSPKEPRDERLSNRP